MKECNFKQGEIKRDNKTFIGIFFLIIGFVLLGKNFQLIPYSISNVLFTWQMLLIVLGISMIIRKGKSVGGLSMIGIGVIFLWDKIIPFSHFEWQIVWPLFLIFIGASLVIIYLFNSIKEISKSGSRPKQAKQHKEKFTKSKHANVEFDIDKIEPIED